MSNRKSSIVSMPRCQGLPSGPCPHNANDESVKSTQGDLFLCRSCDAVRFPPLTTAATTSKRGGRSTKNSASSSAASAHVLDVKCSGCDKMCSAEHCLKCDICSDVFDQQCSTLPKSVFSTLMTIVNSTGWVCVGCRQTCRGKLHTLQANLSSVTQEIARVETVMQQAVDDIKTQMQHMPQSITMSTNAAECDTAIKTCVVKTVKDISRRDCNVIVVGLPVPANGDDFGDDAASFTSFCESHLSVKPAVEAVKRLRQNAVSQKPPLLLVKLRSAQAAKDLRYAAKDLHRNADPAARRVYINRDLTREEAKLAYEERQKRRSRRPQDGNIPDTANPATVNHSDADNSDSDQVFH